MKMKTKFKYTIIGKDFELHTNDSMAVYKVENDFEIQVQLQAEKSKYTQSFLKSEITVVNNCKGVDGTDKEIACIFGYSKNAIREIDEVYKQHEEMDTVILEPNSWMGKELLRQSRKLIDLEHSLAELIRSINQLKKVKNLD